MNYLLLYKLYTIYYIWYIFWNYLFTFCGYIVFVPFLWKMQKDARYATIKDLVSKGYINSLREIFEKELISRSKVARDLGLNPVRFSRNLLNPSRFILKDLYALADLMEIEGIKVLQLVDVDRLTNSKTSRKKG